MSEQDEMLDLLTRTYWMNGDHAGGAEVLKAYADRCYCAGVEALLDAFSDRIPKVQWLWMLQEEAERLLKERKR